MTSHDDFLERTVGDFLPIAEKDQKVGLPASSHTTIHGSTHRREVPKGNTAGITSLNNPRFDTWQVIPGKLKGYRVESDVSPVSVAVGAGK